MVCRRESVPSHTCSTALIARNAAGVHAKGDRGLVEQDIAQVIMDFASERCAMQRGAAGHLEAAHSA